MLHASGATDTGLVRPSNQDCFFIDRERQFCVIADGMGGHNAGEVAARVAVETVAGYIAESAEVPGPFGCDPALTPVGNLLRSAVHCANLRVLEVSATSPALAGMGTTLVVAMLGGDGRLAWAHVGDSRLYLRGRRGLERLTEDDSWVAAILAHNPDADPAVLQHHPMRNALTNVVGARARTDVHVAERPLDPGDVLLLSTDGVHGVLDDGRLEGLLGESDDPSQVAAVVVRAALAAGSRDNCTALVARYQST